MHDAYTYMMSNKSHTLYVGSTCALWQRVIQHKTNTNPAEFTGRYRFTRLVWYESQPSIEEARKRELQIKKWPRHRKVRLIQSTNSNWDDLSRRFLAFLA